MCRWSPNTVQASLRELEVAKSVVSRLQNENPFSDHLPFISNWLIVRSCGHLEATERACIEDLVDRLYGRTVHDYIYQSLFRSGRNPSPDNLKSTLGLIDRSGRLKGSLKDYLSRPANEVPGGNNLSCSTLNDALNEAVKQRNHVVHGYATHPDARSALAYAEVAIRVSDWYLSIFEPGGQAQTVLASYDVSDSDRFGSG